MKLSYRRTFCVGFAFLSICAFWQLYDSIIPLMLKNSFHLKETVSGAIMAIDNVLALFLLPLLGALSDRTHTRLGRRMPFIVVGTLLSAVFAVIIPMAALQQNFVLFFTALGLVLLSMGLYRSPAVALMPDVTPKPLRSKANAVINLMGAAGSVFTLVMVTFLVKEAADGQLTDYRPVFTAVAILMVACVVVLLLTVRENRMAAEVPVEEEEKKEEASGVHMTKDVRKSLIFLLLSVFFLVYRVQRRDHRLYPVCGSHVGRHRRRFCRGPHGGNRGGGNQLPAHRDSVQPFWAQTHDPVWHCVHDGGVCRSLYPHRV